MPSLRPALLAVVALAIFACVCASLYRERHAAETRAATAEVALKHATAELARLRSSSAAAAPTTAAVAPAACDCGGAATAPPQRA